MLPRSPRSFRILITHVRRCRNIVKVFFFGKHTIRFRQDKATVVWRKDLLVLFMIFELGSYLESLWHGLPSEPIGCGVKEFFHPKK